MNELLEFLRTHEEAFRSRARLASLYSDFRNQRQTNPDGYHANASAWMRALTAAANAGLIPSSSASSQHDHFVLQTGEELARALQTQELGRPLALESVIDEAVRRKELIPVKEFLEAKESIYAKHWLPTPWQVMSWGLRQLGVIGGDSSEDKLVRGEFVIMDNLEATAKAALDHVSKTASSYTARIFSRDLLASTLCDALDVSSLSQRDTSVLLMHLARDQAAIAYDPATGTVKFHAPGEMKPASIEQEDITIASLRTWISGLEPQIQQLIQRVSELDAKAREAVGKKQNAAAKVALRQKKMAETKLQSRTATLTQVEEVYAKIEQAADQVEIVRVMEASSTTLRSLNQKTGGVEKVQDVMENLRESMQDTEEISGAISEVGAGQIDEGEVDDELEALEKAEREKVEEAERKEREAREEKEAEETKKKLAELEGLKKPDEVSSSQEAEEVKKRLEAVGQSQQ
ncbi:hypothetical protein KC332_g3743 [Hortaea werneckii]|uniref:SNF7 family protein n=2 Tax=Hortaea werneckii TaxID=91943 RepID=A0A3M7J9R7_HORWE|nr:hypothetical protein KC358_g2842 [Hortaea werneckii]OTA34013.1 hypothetical protein BTJ68_05498 [Hortaea werneckii EXF-2000]KAI6850249.1 hypothetical protein KC350_g2217 [Hortaea werneckii]KAI6923676.1 hypothetical protein KC341_g14562 [Hortaea werneckii]KAI6929224.1 hypothetical protein KC348_g7911 [Hortaea werneckii]